MPGVQITSPFTHATNPSRATSAGASMANEGISPAPTRLMRGVFVSPGHVHVDVERRYLRNEGSNRARRGEGD